ncbi:MAG: hypothetical protein HY548_05055 [Elusimicrobia bacterium]|nr:hypothetical protein [Elusimicrobiota bacterium]
MTAGIAVAFGTEGVKLSLSTREDGDQEHRFPCAGRIYANLRLPPGPGGRRTIEGRWVRPDGKQQELTSLVVPVSPKGRIKATLWMEFHPNEDSLLDEFKMGGDYAAAEAHPFHGGWKFELLQDSRMLAEQDFDVVCSE